jgi:hypothetical protein
MYSTTKIIRTISFIGACALAAATARAVTPPPDGGYPNQNTAEGKDALFSLATGGDNTAMGFDALDSKTTGSDKDLASWIWRAAGRLNTARYFHTATLLPNGKVLVAGGYNSTFLYLASAEFYDPGSGTWTATGSLNTARGTHTATLLRNGRVLVAGGYGNNSNVSASVELYSRRAGPGLPQTASTSHVISTRRRRYKTAQSLLQGDLTQTRVVWRGQNWDALPPKIH